MITGKRMKALIIAVLVCSLILISSAATADDTQSSKRSYFGITAAGVFPQDLSSEDVPLRRIPFPDVDLSSGGMLGVRLGHAPKKLSGTIALPIEIEAFMITGTDIDDELYYREQTGTNVKIDADISVIAAMLNFILNCTAGRFHPYGGFGLGWTWFDMGDATLTLDPGVTWPETGTRTNSLGDFRDDAFGYQVLLGLGFDLTNALSLDVGYRYFSTEPEVQFAGGADLNVKMTYSANMITFGLSYRF